MIRWNCPQCGRGKNAPARMRRDDTRRYCLPCSESTGRLVERIASALVAQRQRSATASAAKASRARRRETAKARARWTHGDLDLRREIARLWKHGRAVAEARGTRIAFRPDSPTLTLYRSTAYPLTASGRAWFHQHRIHLTVGRTAPRPDLESLLAHEVAHLLTPGCHHNAEFHAMLGDLMQRAYGRQPETRMP